MFASKLLILTVLSLQAWDSMGLIFRQIPLQKPDVYVSKPGCYSPITRKVLPIGVNIYPAGICKRLYCTKNGYTAVHSCDKKLVPRGCHLIHNRELRYPHCCGKVVCDVYSYNNDRYYDPIARRYVYADDLDYDEYDSGPTYIDYARRPVYIHDYVQPALVYDDGRGDDYKLQEDTKIYYGKKNETSRRAPWNKNPTV